MITRPTDEESIFCKALECPSSEVQAAYLEEACRGDVDLRRRVEDLLRVRAAHASFLAEPAVFVGDRLARRWQASSTGDDVVGSCIGPYQLLERIGEGGFGVVYLAEQREPVQRRVALKIIKAGMDTRQVIARFEAERQALAMMDHPNIAKIFDAGATDAQSPLGGGRPYFVMELVKGVPITQFCSEQRLALRERLQIFCDVCHATQHAHQKGVIHRDLKPSNILVARGDDADRVTRKQSDKVGRARSCDRDGSRHTVIPSNVVTLSASAQPKVIDFGIAKAVAGRLTDKTLSTEMRHLIGTPTYMSPEQAGLSDLDIDTRSDIYSLGALLYELLTGKTPFDAKALFDSGYDEMRRIIREVEPEKPSTRLASLSTTGTKARRHDGAKASEPHPQNSESPWRGSWPSRHSEPGPQARSSPVATQDSSAADGLPLRSFVPSWLRASDLRGDLDWIVMKSLEKDRTRRYETANALALEIERFLNDEPVLAGPPSRLYRFRKFVRRNRVVVTAAAMVTLALLVGMAGTTFGLLRAEERRIEAEAARGREREQRELAEKREKQTQQVSDFQAAMLEGIDVEAMGRGIKDHFREQVRAALKRQYIGEGQDRRQRTPEEVDAELAAFDKLAGAAQAVDVARQVMDEFVLDRAADALEKQFVDQPLVQAQLHFALGNTYRELGILQTAEPHLRAALEIRRHHYGPENAHAEVAECLYDLGQLMDDKGKLPEAEALLRESLTIWRSLHGEEHQMVARTLDSLAGVVIGQGRLDEAESLLNEALRLNRKHCDEDDPEVLSNLADLATLCWKKQQFQEAEELHREVLERRRRLLGERDPTVAGTLFNLAQAIASQGRHAEAEQLFRDTLAIYCALYGDENRIVAKTMSSLGLQLESQGRRAEAEAMYREALAQQRRSLGDDHPDVRITLGRLSALRRHAGDCDEEVKLRRESLAIAERLYPDGDPEAWRRFSAAGDLEIALAGQAKALFPADRERARALFDESVTLSRESLAIAERLYPDEHPEAWRRFTTMGQLGFALARLAKALILVDRERALALFQEAELLLTDYMEMLLSPGGGRLEERRRAAEQTIGVFEFWHSVVPDRGWGEQAAAWRTELEKQPGR